MEFSLMIPKFQNQGCLSTFCYCEKLLRKKNQLIRKKVWFCGFQEFIPCFPSLVALGLWRKGAYSRSSGEEADQKWKGLESQGHDPSHLTSSFLKMPAHPVEPQANEPALSMWAKATW